MMIDNSHSSDTSPLGAGLFIPSANNYLGKTWVWLNGRSIPGGPLRLVVVGQERVPWRSLSGDWSSLCRSNTQD